LARLSHEHAGVMPGKRGLGELSAARDSITVLAASTAMIWTM